MIYSDLTKKSLKISFNAHKNQVDKSGMPYVFHPFHLAEQMDDEYSVCVALLHDVVEDTDITIEDLNIKGMMKNKHLSKAVQQQSLYEFRRQLAYKSKRNNIELRVVDRWFPSSKTCSECGYIKSDLKLKDRVYV